MGICTDIYNKELKAIKERLIKDIKFFVAMEEQCDSDEYDGYEDVHLVRLYEGLPSEYVTLTVRRYCKDYVLAYTNDYDLIKEFNGKKWFWTPEEHRNLMFVGNYIIKIPYEHVALEDLFCIADFVYNDGFMELLNSGITWKSYLEQLKNNAKTKNE